MKSSLLALVLLASPAVAADDLVPVRWLVVGPFESGSREGLVHPLAMRGTLPTVAEIERDGASWPSVLAQGGRAGVTRVDATLDDKGAAVVKLALGGVDWDARQNEWGAAGVLGTAILASRIRVETDGLFLLDAARVSGTIGGVAVAGDPYGMGIARSVIALPAGTHDVMLQSVGFGGEREVRFGLRRVRPEDGVLQVVEPDILLPDVVEGSARAGMAAIPILNLTNDWIDGVSVEITSADYVRRKSSPFPLAPRSPMKMSVPLAWDAGATSVTVRVLSPRGGAIATASLTVRAPGEPHVETFVSRIDGSTQAMGVSRRATDPRSPLILSLHGAGVGPHGQVMAYRNVPFDVVAPTNRRPYGFDWHDWGRLDALEVLAEGLDRLGADPRRVVLAGQSMGGHGAWTIGTHHPDRFAAITPAAAWIGYDTVVPFTARKSTAAPPELQAIHARAMAPGRVAEFLDNLEHVPVLAYHGGSDDNISPMNARLLASLAERRGLDVRLCEAAGEKHWSDLDIAPGDTRGGCISRDAVETFWRDAPPVTPPRHVTIVATDLDAGDSAYWLTILEQDRVATDTRVDATIADDGSLDVVTRNVVSFAIDDARISRAVVDGQRVVLSSPGAGESISIRREGREWRRASERRPFPSPNAHPGSLVKALFEPFLIVVGTKAHEARHVELARLLAEAWWVRGNGLAPIVRDVDLDDSSRGIYNLVLLGGPDDNVETARLAPGLNIAASGGRMRLGDGLVAGTSLASMHWERRPDRPGREVLVLQSTDDASAALLPLMSPFAPGAGWPDFVIATPRVRELGWGGFAAAGFWNRDFRYTPADAWLMAAPQPLPRAGASRSTPRR